MQTAVSNTIMGVSIVFFVLVSLSFLIYLFRFIPMLEEKLTKKKIAEPVKQEVPVEKELVDDLELIAVITAAIAASEGKDPRQYIVRSIKKVHRNQW
jgi:sodium pump decarboxylase gamma subunit